MASQHWREVKRLFDEAGGLLPAERSALLACAETAIRSEVQSLLEADERAGGFLASGPAVLAEAHDALIGSRLGPYEIVGVLGRGGMGVVYLARREAPTRLVAIKMVRPGGESEEALRRFRAEAQILARLEHAGIARLLDAGTTPQGRPYVVMEHVTGVPLGSFCAERRPALRSRLELFASLCDAVGYAHGRLVVHRDLKPANVLVTPDGEPRLLDFGIGKLLDEETQATATRTGLRLMTPEYASPEQVRGEPVSVATDVHALGLLLHFLLTGAGPFRLSTSSPEELVRVVCREEPMRPSQAVSSPPPERAFEPLEPPERLVRLLRGDLDAIVAQALAKDAGRRYASVEQLADDVRRHLAGEPVRAQRDTLAYRAGKFLRRNRLAVAAAAAIGLSLLGGIVSTSWQARAARAERARAERRFGDVRRLANAMLFPLYDRIRDLPGSTAARELLVTEALKYLDSLASEAHGDVTLQRELAGAYVRVADVQGQPGAANLGNTPGALASYRKALALFDPLAAGAPRDAELCAEQAHCHLNIGRLQEDAGDFDAAVTSIERSLEIAGAGALLAPQDVSLQGYVLKAGGHLGNIRLYQGDLAAAFVALERTLRRAESAAGQSRDADVLRPLPQAYVNLARAFREARDFASALELYAKARAVNESLVAADPLNVRPRRALSLAHLETANILSDMGRWPEALASIQESIAISRAQLREDPRNAVAIHMLIVGEQTQCRAEAHTSGRLGAACESSLKAAQARAAERPGHTRSQVDLIDAQHALGDALQYSGQYARARDVFREALALAEALGRARPGDMRPAAFILELQTCLGEVLVALGDWAGAESALGAAVALGRPPAEAGNARAAAQLFRVYCAIGAGRAQRAKRTPLVERRARWIEARVAYRQALDLLEGPQTRDAFRSDAAAARQRAARGLAEAEAEATLGRQPN